MFNVQCYDIESFEKGWIRYLKEKFDYEGKIPELPEEDDLSEHLSDDDAVIGTGDIEIDETEESNEQESCCSMAKCRENIQKLLYKNNYMTKLFPVYKQQKPGYDYYSFILTVQMILLVYIMAFYTSMNGQKTTIAE